MTTTKWGNSKDANLYQLLNLVLQNVAGAHSSTVEGTISANTAQHRPQFYNGTTNKLIAFTDDVVSSPEVAAEDVTYAGSSGLSATDVEAALDELDSEKATQANIDTAINNLVASAPGALNTLDELAAALGDDANFAATVTAALAARVQTYALTIGDGAATSFNVDHNFGTKDVICQAYIISSGAQYEPDFDRTTTNRVVVTTGTPAIATNSVRVLIQGVDV